MNETEKIIRDLIRKESLRVIKESQASFLNEDTSSMAENTMEDVNNVIGVFEKKLEKLNGEERSAMDQEDYITLRDIKQSQLSALNKMIKMYETKVGILIQQKNTLEVEVSDVSDKGADVFKNQEMNEFSSEGFKKGWGLRIETQNFFINLVKQMDETNNFKIVSTNIPGVSPGFATAIPNLAIGGGGSLPVYSNIGGRYEELPNPINLKNIKSMYKNPK